MIIKQLKYKVMDQNTYIVSNENRDIAFIIDPACDIEKIDKYVKEKNIILEYIILTHGHIDHIKTCKELKEKYPEIKIIAYFDEKEVLMNPKYNLSTMFGMGEIELEADIYVSDGEKIKIGDLNLTFIHTPGHTVGSMCILVNDMDLFTGDTLFEGSIGRTDFYGSSYTKMIASLKKLKKLDDDIKIYPGHGGISTIGNEKKYNMFMRQV